MILVYTIGACAHEWVLRRLKKRRERLEASIVEPEDEVPATDRHTVFIDGRPDSF